MTIAGFNRLQIQGTIRATEIWSCGFNFGSTAGEATIDREEDLAAAAATIRGLNGGNIVPASARALMGAQLQITGFRLSEVDGTDFKETAVATVALAASIYGTGNNLLPQEVACALTLDTGRAGRQYRGRVYWPACGAAMSPELRFDGTALGTLAGDMGQWMHDVAGAIQGAITAGGAAPAGGVCRPLVVSRAGGHVSAITQVRAGDVPDVQRRRRNSEKERYSVGAVPQ